MLVNTKKSFFCYFAFQRGNKMRKIVVFLCLILPFVAVKAQTFQRKTRQPAFFMPQSALSTQQQERLPAIENMNYQGQRPSSIRYGQQEQNKTQPTETKPISDTSAQIKTQPQIKTKETIIEKVETKNPAPVKTQAQLKPEPAKVAEKTVTQAENPKITAQNKEKKTTINTSDNYQATFSQILNRHKADLMRIRQGDYTQSADVTAMIESYKPLKKTVSDRVNPRSVVIK